MRDGHLARAGLRVWRAGVLALGLLGLTVLSAAAQAPEPTAEQVKAYLEHRTDPVVGAWVEQQLKNAPAQPAASAAGGTAAAAAAPATPAPAAEDSVEGQIEDLAEQRQAVIRAHLADLKAALPTIGGDIASALGTLVTELSGHGVLELVLLMAGFIGLGLVLEWLYVRQLSASATRLVGVPRTPGQRGRAALLRLLFGLGRVLAFTLGSVGAFLLFSWPPFLRQVVLGYLVAALVYRSATAVCRFVVAPDEPATRLVPLDDAAASFWLHRVATFVGVYAFGYVTVFLLHRLGLSFAGGQLLAYLIGLVLLGIALSVVWRRARNTAGRVIGTIICVLIYVAWVIGAKPSMWLLILVPGTWLVMRLSRAIAAHLFRPAELEPGEEPEPASPWAVVADRVARAVAILLGLWLLTWAWGIDVVEVAGRGTPATNLLVGAIQAVVILLAANLVWQVLSRIIDRQLHAASAGGHGHGHGHGGPALTPEESRRLGRLRTLLPILRIVALAVLGTMAVLMALSSLGLQIGPLVAGAGVIGVAIGFGSQTLVKDIVSGMFYLFDDAFRVGEYIVSGSYKGTVEGFSLRSIKLRHHRGPIFTVPFGELGAVQNLSRDWVIEKLTVGVTYDTDLDKVKKVIKQVSKEIMADPELAAGIIEPLKSQGVDAMGDFAIQVKMKFMAKPGEQFVVRRAIYAKIKKAFDANGIEFAFPTVTVAGGSEATPAVAQAALAMTKPAGA
ncbi:MAG: mechanosensitive ion channel family protein [Geminicoccaceae bacterium]